MRMTKIVTTGLIVTSAFAMATSASAYSSQKTTVQTTITKADLQSEADIKRTYASLKETAIESCRSEGFTSLSERAFARQCTVRLMDDFIESVDHAGLTDYHENKVRG